MMDTELLLRNCINVKDGYPMRLSENLLAAYDAMSPEFSARARCTAGVKLSFITAARELSFRYEIISWCRSVNICDLFENGVLTGSARMADMQSHGTVSFIRRGTGEARIDIWLPNTCGVRILEADIGNWRPAPAPLERVLLLGDSILQGIATYHPSCTLADLLLRRPGTEGVNQSVGGAYFDPDHLEPVGFAPDRILIAMGANDAWNAPETYRERIPAYFRRVRELFPDTPVTAVSPVWGTSVETNGEYRKNLDEVRTLICESAGRVRAGYIDGTDLIPHHRDFYNEDGCHPNDLGFTHYAMNLERALQF